MNKDIEALTEEQLDKAIKKIKSFNPHRKIIIYVTPEQKQLIDKL